MPRAKKQQVVLPTTSLVASATRYQGEVARIYHPAQPWQSECYRHYAICGEARFAARFFGRALSRAKLSAGTIGTGGKIEAQATGSAADVLTDLFNGRDGQAQMLEAIGIHLTVAGECYLVGRTSTTAEGKPGEEIWEIVSVLEMQVTGSKWKIIYGIPGVADVELSDDDVVIRIWLPNPARRMEADSPFRSLLPILNEIEWLTKMVFSQITSRLAGNGILFLPQGMTFPPPPAVDGEQPQTTNDAESFMLVLADGMLTPIDNPGSPAAKVPIVVTAPGEEIDKAKWMTFWSELDSEAKALRAEAIVRFAVGMDLPAEQVLGMSSNQGTGGGNSNGVSHWGAWQIEEATIKMHVEPMLELVVNALTIGYVRPLTNSATDVVVYDTSALRLRPDRSKEAIELYDRGLISLDAMLREVGFQPEDKMTDDERKVWLLRKIASGSATPEQVAAAARALGVDIPAPATPQAQPNEARPDPSLEDHPTRPRTPAESSLVPVAEALVLRAMERAGNRIRQKGTQPPGVAAYETHCYGTGTADSDYLLQDAWSTAGRVLAGVCDVDRTVEVLDSYCRTLIAEHAPHSRERLTSWLALADEAKVSA